MAFILKKESTEAFLKEVSNSYTVFAPLRHSSGDIHFDRLRNNQGKVYLGRGAPLIPPKRIGFPQLEKLLKFENARVEDLGVETGKHVLFGIRPCDLKGILFVDDFFRRNFEDSYYLRRSAERISIVLVCNDVANDGCFCTQTGCGPFLKEGYDVQIVDIGESFLLEVGSEKGRDFIKKFRSCLKDAGEREKETSLKVKSDAQGKIKLKFDFEKALRILCEDKVPQEMYEEISDRCITCGGCLYVCPTCTCFNVFDRKVNSCAIRYRCWDACIFEGYSKASGGFNPRGKKFLRTARRYEHKLKYDYEMTGMSGCVGCGRCLLTCPVEIGFSKFIQNITDEK